MNLISQRLKTRREGGDREGGEINGSGREKMRFRAKIRASESESAEKELRREIRCVCVLCCVVCVCVGVPNVCICVVSTCMYTWDCITFACYASIKP